MRARIVLNQGFCLARWPSKTIRAPDEHEHVRDAPPGHRHGSARQVQHVVDGSSRNGHRVAHRVLARDDHQSAFLTPHFDELSSVGAVMAKADRGREAY